MSRNSQLATIDENNIPDGRRDRAGFIEAAVCQYYNKKGYIALGQWQSLYGDRPDITVIDRKTQELIHIEIKTCKEDCKVDKKWQNYKNHCHKLYFAVLDIDHLTPDVIGDKEVGVILVIPRIFTDKHSKYIISEVKVVRKAKKQNKTVPFTSHQYYADQNIVKKLKYRLVDRHYIQLEVEKE